jgi:hypothetical protein
MEKEKTEPGKGYKSSVISNEQELNDYLTRVKDDMEKILNDGKKSSWNETKCQQPPTYYSFKEKLPPIYYINS